MPSSRTRDRASRSSRPTRTTAGSTRRNEVATGSAVSPSRALEIRPPLDDQPPALRPVRPGLIELNDVLAMADSAAAGRAAAMETVHAAMETVQQQIGIRETELKELRARLEALTSPAIQR